MSTMFKNLLAAAEEKVEILDISVNVHEYRVSTPKKKRGKKFRQHKSFDKLLTLAHTRDYKGHHKNIMMIGEKGVGKSTACEKLAEILDRPFYFHGAVGDEFKLKGFIDANGNFHETQYFKGWQEPSVIMLDELDASDPNALLSINTDLANKYADFPTGKFDQHRDCLIVGCTNTDMRGATSAYSGRATQDSALRDRFLKLDWPLDEDLELLYCGKWAHWGKFIQAVRFHLSAIEEDFLSPRSSYSGAEVLQTCASFNHSFPFAWDLCVNTCLMHDYDSNMIDQIIVRKECAEAKEQIRMCYAQELDS